MRLALIPPIDLLEYTSRTNMQLMLPQLANNGRYACTYKTHCADPEQYVILDNGANESEEATFERLLEIAHDFNVDEIVIPDVIGDMHGTLKQLTEFGNFLSPDDSFNFMFVAQGQTLTEFKQSIQTALTFPFVTTIGLPRHLPTTTGVVNGRAIMAKWMQDWHGDEDVDVHLLGGVPTQPVELRTNFWPDIVRSHDTSAPFNFAYHGLLLRRGNVAKRPENYFDLPAEKFSEGAMLQNIFLLKEWTGA